MKKNFLILVVLIAVSGVVCAKSIDEPKAPKGMAVMKNGSIFKLFYKGVDEGTVKVTIYDERGDAVFTETLRKVSNFVRPYNFSSLKEGEYTIELVNDSGKQIEKVVYTKGAIEHKKTSEKLLNLVRVKDANDKYMLMVSNKERGAITVKIYNSAHELLYKHKEILTGDFAKVYTLDKYSGNVLFEVIDENGISKTLQCKSKK
jgi:hypothetical protein